MKDLKLESSEIADTHIPDIAGRHRRIGAAAAQAEQLREAHRLIAEMGATGHADRIARELRELKG